MVITSPVDFNRSEILGNPIATSPRPSNTGTLQLAVGSDGSADKVTDGLGVGVTEGDGVGVGVGVGVTEGDGVGVGVGVGAGSGLIDLTFCQTSFLFFFTHLYSAPFAVAVLPIFGHLSPALTAAKEGNEIKDKTSIATIQNRFIR
ncbi:MAG: hypothetical protein RLZZ159_26 [Actinomycetota bacterium]